VNNRNIKTDCHIFRLIKLRILFFILHSSFFLLFFGCQSGKGHTDTPTSGSMNISADDSYMPLVAAEINVFQNIYAKTKIQARFVTEDSAFIDLLNDSVRLIVAGRKLTPKEVEYFHSKQIFPEQVKIATDALALIVNNDNDDTLLSLDRLKAIFAGKDTNWAMAGGKTISGKISVVFDHSNSSNARYMKENLMAGGKFPDYCFALHGNPEVVDYVSKNKNALGIIGVNWISDDNDSTVIGFLKKVKVVAVSDSNGSGFYQPYPYYIKEGKYSLCRDVYIISCEPYSGLGSGFLAFVASDKGQRIALRAGILPATVPTHIINF
jgi:phosphate transport system substrate-binding protein